nr:imidazolonepropionase [Acidobacteriota bacterium]
MQPADLVIRNAREILTCAGPAPLAGARQKNVSSVRDGALASFEGRLTFVGSTRELDRTVSPVPGATILDATEYAVVPGFVDAHTHAVFAGDRREELRRRLGGATYAEIAAGGGGIVATVAATRVASEDELVAQS